MEGYFNVKAPPFNATGTGSTNDSPKIQEAIKQAAVKGGVVFFPPGTYLIDPVRPGSDRGIHVNAPVILAGTGPGVPFREGSNLLVTHTDHVPIWISGRGTVMRDLGIHHQHPNLMSSSFKEAIRADADDIRLENIFLGNPTIGVICENRQRLSINRLYGQPLKTGVHLDATRETTIDNVHFGPHWSTDPAVKNIISNQATAIESYHNERPLFSNIATTGYHTAFLFGKKKDAPKEAITTNFQIMDSTISSGARGIVFDAPLIAGQDVDWDDISKPLNPLITGQIANYVFQGLSGASTETGIKVAAPGANIQATNVRIARTGANAIRVSEGAVLHLDNVCVESWNQSGQGFPAIEPVDGIMTLDGSRKSVGGESRIFVGFNRQFVLNDARGKRIEGKGTAWLADPVLPGINAD